MDRITQIGRHPSGGIDIGTTKDVPALVAHVSCLDQNAVRQLPWHAQGVFHASRHFQMGVDGSHAGSGWSPYADCADTGVERRQLTVRGGHIDGPRRLTLKADAAQGIGFRLVVENSKAAANDCLLAKRGIPKTAPRWRP